MMIKNTLTNLLKMNLSIDSGFLCAICDWSGEVDLPITTNFFWPSR